VTRSAGAIGPEVGCVNVHSRCVVVSVERTLHYVAGCWARIVGASDHHELQTVVSLHVPVCAGVIVAALLARELLSSLYVGARLSITMDS
jgi:hypothetical protein